MSLIAGVVKTDQAVDFPADDGLRLMQAMRNYPADDSRVWHDRFAFLGCHAQRVTPESVHEVLPLYKEELRLAITADAFLDNRDELCDRLRIPFPLRNGMSDGELILLAYEKWGEDSAKFLLGDFAFVIWDADKRQLFGSRDLTGSRTLYYAFERKREKFVFCSAVAPMFSVPGIERELDRDWLADFLALPTALDSTDPGSTAYRHIGQIPPGHSFTLRNGRLSLTRYGSLVSEERLNLSSDGEYEEAFRDVFGKAVAARLRTHKQVGATLSGGLDSGSVASFAAMALRHEGKTLYTYSSVPAPDFKPWTAPHMVPDERPFIRETVRHAGNIRDRYLNCPGRSPYSEIDEWLRMLEMPYKFFENSFWIKEAFESARSEGIGVLLTGAKGNNTVSWGSAAQYCVFLLKKWQWIRFYRQATLLSKQMKMRRSRLFPKIGMLAAPFPGGFPFSGAKPERTFPSMIHPDFAAKTQVFEKKGELIGRLENPNESMLEERQNYLGNLALLSMQGMSGAKLSLRYGLWERDPTSDPRVVRFCLSVPIEQYVLNGVGRSLIRRATERYLPDKVRLNMRFKGVQATDWVHRMLPSWPEFVREAKAIGDSAIAAECLNVAQIRSSLAKLEAQPPKPELAIDPDMKLVMRGLIVNRFLKSFE